VYWEPGWVDNQAVESSYDDNMINEDSSTGKECQNCEGKMLISLCPTVAKDVKTLIGHREHQHDRILGNS